MKRQNIPGLSPFVISKYFTVNPFYRSRENHLISCILLWLILHTCSFICKSNYWSKAASVIDTKWWIIGPSDSQWRNQSICHSGYPSSSHDFWFIYWSLTTIPRENVLISDRDPLWHANKEMACWSFWKSMRSASTDIVRASPLWLPWI